jgi:hypothetical protein
MNLGADLPHPAVIKRSFYKTFRYVRHRDADAYLKLGWVPTGAFVSTYYEQFSVLFVWMCDCPAPQPRPPT